MNEEGVCVCEGWCDGGASRGRETQRVKGRDAERERNTDERGSEEKRNRVETKNVERGEGKEGQRA